MMLLRISDENGLSHLPDGPLSSWSEAPSTRDEVAPVMSIKVDLLRDIDLEVSADWCITCKVNERTVLAGSELPKRRASLHERTRVCRNCNGSRSSATG
jgi:hypothetical protein